MVTTHFRPSIHGWPFANSYDYKVDLPFHDATINNLGYCGGMCWTVLDRFYSATRIPRDTPQPQQGQALYDEILAEQVVSLSFGTLAQIYSWQRSPRLSHATNPHHSQGYLTKQEWPRVRARLDQSLPVTLTLIAHSNDYDISDMSDNHRVVAYAYDVRGLASTDWVHGQRHASIRHVTIWIYDPNRPNEDDVCLTFFTGCDDEWIGLRHSVPGNDFRAFFLDDRNRSYQYNEATKISIDSCVVSGISDYALADVDLTFSWKCAFIPYFSVQVNGADWQLNAAAQQQFAPDGINKQCAARTGSLTVNLKVPRAMTTVGVRLLASDGYADTIEVDATPSLLCQPYVRTRFAIDAQQVYDSAIQDADLFVKDASPTEAAIQALDDSPDRWVHIESRVRRDAGGSGARWTYTSFDTYRLGNIKGPILANFVGRNLAAPTRITGTLRLYRAGSAGPQETSLGTLNPNAQQIWAGLTNNPGDYDGDTRVELTFEATDRFYRRVTSLVTFYGRSILATHSVVAISVPDPKRIAKLQDVAQELVELGLIETAIAIPDVGAGDGGFSPQPRPIDQSLWKRLQENTSLRAAIREGFKQVWSDVGTWEKADITQNEISQQASRDISDPSAAPRDLAQTKMQNAERQAAYDAALVGLFSAKGIETLRRDSSLSVKLKELTRQARDTVVARRSDSSPDPR